MPGTVTVGCKLPHGLKLSHGGKHVVVAGLNGSRIVGGYGLTPNVDKDFFDAWLKENASMVAVKKELVFAQERDGSAAAFAKEHAGERNGFEGIDPKTAGVVKAENYEGMPKE